MTRDTPNIRLGVDAGTGGVHSCAMPTETVATLEPQPVQPGEFCTECSTTLNGDAWTITVLGFGEVAEVCSTECLRALSDRWEESES